MAAYKLRSADLDAVRKVASDYAELKTGYRSWFPVETIPRSVTSKWYTLNRVVTPAISMDGGDYVGVRTARTEDSAPVFWMRYKFHWDITEVESAARNGVPLKADDVRVATRQMDNKIAQVILEGLDFPDTVNGLTEDGTDLGGTLDLVVVGTADSFITHASTAYAHMISNGLAGPYNWIVSDGIYQYLGLPLGAGGGVSQGNYINQTFGFTTYMERAIATASWDAEETLEETIYPWRYTDDDGIWCLIAASPENLALQEVAPPTVIVNPEINRETNKYEGFVEWQGTLRVTHTAAAAYMEDVDVA